MLSLRVSTHKQEWGSDGLGVAACPGVVQKESRPFRDSDHDREVMSIDKTQVAINETQPWLSDSDSPRCKHGVTFTGHMR